MRAQLADHHAWDETTSWYDENSKNYIKKTQGTDPTEDITHFAQFFEPGAKILDFGCGSGRDVKAFNDMGFDAHGLDGSQAMYNHCVATSTNPDKFRLMNFKDYADAPKSWDGIWAMASLLHVPKQSHSAVFSKLIASLKPKGVLKAYMKYGFGETRDKEGRHISLITASEVTNMLMPMMTAGSRLSVRIVNRPQSDRKLIKWVAVEVIQ